MLFIFDKVIYLDNVRISELEAIVFSPFLYHLNHVFTVGVACVLQHLDHFNQSLFVLLSGHNQLEYTNCSTTLTFPEFWVCVKSFKDVECLD